MAFVGKNTVWFKIMINDLILEQVAHFKYLGCNISYEYDNDLKDKHQAFQEVCGTINRTLRNQT
jgi:hypothetical protein